MAKTAVLILLISLVGCAGPARDYTSTSTATICHDLARLPSYNLWHKARTDELARRGATCGDPSGLAAARARTDQAYGSFIRSTLANQHPIIATYDAEWDWDQLYDQRYNLVWACRGVQTGEFADPMRCSGKFQSDGRWPGK